MASDDDDREFDDQEPEDGEDAEDAGVEKFNRKPKARKPKAPAGRKALIKRMVASWQAEESDPVFQQEERERIQAEQEERKQREAARREFLRTNRTLIPASSLESHEAFMAKQPTINDGGEDLRTLPRDLFRHLKKKAFLPVEYVLELLKGWAARCEPPRAWMDVEADIAPLLAELQQEIEEGERRRLEREQMQREELEKRKAEEKQKVASGKAARFGLVSGSEWVARSRARDEAERWIIVGLLVRGQSAIMAGPVKSLKTSLALYLALGIASGLPVFGGKFGVPKKRPVMVLSAESGEEALRASAEAICALLGTDLAEADIHLGFKVPSLGKRNDDDRNIELEILGDLLAERRIELLVVDPAYLACIGVDGTSLSAMGGALQGLDRVCSKVGCTLLVIHHSRKGLPVGQAMQLDDLAGAGYAEFFRQWLLVNRREAYDPSRPGEHALLLNYGGSAGHTGILALDVNEGSPGDDVAARRWKVCCRTPQEAEEQAKNARPTREAIRDARTEATAARVVNKLRELGGSSAKGVARKDLQAVAGLNGTTLKAALQLLVERKNVRIEEVEKKVGGKVYKPQTIFLLRDPEGDTATGTGDNSPGPIPGPKHDPQTKDAVPDPRTGRES